MMRKTYKSKKDAGGAFDHRDVLQTIDEKSSAFDAYYIQNIKQTKRELSSIGSSNHHGVASNRVRKRKYVKRIVKEVECVPHKSVSESVFLTPDKSIRVNKAPDPFDQLLMSSPAWPEVKQTRNEDPFDNFLSQKMTKTDKKAYTRKKTRPVKKVNYSFSSDSDKENSSVGDKIPQNTTDIKSHQLFIEKEATPSPQIDDSINKIVKNLSLLNQLQCKSTVTKVKKPNNNRLTKNLSSPMFRVSPLSSTPFNNKRRSNSIYKFSPIQMGQLEGSPSTTNFKTIGEEIDEPLEQNKSVVFLPKSVTNSLKTSRNNSQSPHQSDRAQKSSKTLFSSQELRSLHQDNMKSCEDDDMKCENKETTFQTSELEPFQGFDINNSNAEANTSVILPLPLRQTSKSSSQRSIDSSKTDHVIQSTTPGSQDLIKNDDQSMDFSIEKKEQEETKNDSVLENEVTAKAQKNDTGIPAVDKSVLLDSEVSLTVPSEPFLGFDLNENDDSYASDDVAITKSAKDTSNDPKKSVTLDHDDNLSQSTGSSGENEYSVDDKSSEDLEKESLYDTCNSEQNSIADESNDFVKEPLVAIERLNDSLFYKYYNKMKHDPGNETNDTSENGDDKSNESSQSDPIEKYSEEASEAYASLDDTEISENSDNFSGGQLDGTQTDNFTGQDSNLDDHNDDVSYGENLTTSDISDADATVTTQIEKRCFVTTRRRKEAAKNISTTVLDDTNTANTSQSSAESDKTVLNKSSNNLLKKSNHDFDAADREMDKNKHAGTEDTMVAKDFDYPDTELSSSHTEPRVSFVTKRNSSRLPTMSKKPDICESSELDIGMKPAIVLQPGKKWERSLSIYRRMTLADDHFERTILEEDNLHQKGRRYRQSVLSMMEMQDVKGTLHNDSIQSRRSTFVRKPSRSTIRIVRDSSSSRISLCSTSTDLDELRGFLEDCDDTIVELSKLSIDDHDVTVLEKYKHSRVVATARDSVLRRCNQTEPLLFDECYPDTVLKNCRKIGEGVYGEVYLWRAPDGRARVMKVVPIAGSVRVNGECQKDFHEIISEIVIAMELSALRAPIAEIECHFDEGKDADQLDLHSVENATDVFNEVLAVRCVYGSYPSRLLDLWDLYDECKGSENDNPAVLPADQLYIVLELANAGQDLESYQFASAEQAHALLLQVAFGLAVGEEACQFEHRDLHWGNVLIAPTDQKYATFVLRGRSHRVPRCGVAATIIDYSLSRVSLPAAGGPCALYNDLATDEGLFGAVGDYQFEVYRLMREKLGNEWKNFEPYTNILWLHYLADKMITALRYKRPGTKLHKQYIAKLKAVKERLLSYGSAQQFVLTDNEF